ncbi:MAG: hypothetical protein ABJB22_04620 [Verrucomicrobiota bacterium]
MKNTTDPRKAFAHGNRPKVYDRSTALRSIRWLIWLYIILLVLEGALRKWIVPQFSNPLLIVRDPVVITIYLLAIRARVFPTDRFTISLFAIGMLSWLVGLIVLEPYLPLKPLMLVTAFGFRSNFFHLPLIFVIAKVLNERDVRKVGWWTMLTMIPMGLLMAAQFQASPDSFINRTVGLGEGEQITAGGGKIRPPGSFSFVSGAIFFTTAATAFLLEAALSRAKQNSWLLFGSGFAVVVAVAVSGSRSVVASVLLVVLSLLAILLLRPEAINKFGRNLLMVVVAGMIISHLPIFKEGLGILSDRFTASAEASDMTVTGGIVNRVLTGFTEGFTVFNKLPLAGYGLGIGTNAGAKFLTGRSGFLLAEGEWARVLLESGPILGLAFLLWRTILTLRLGYLSFLSLKRGEILPLLIFSAGFTALLNGQFGQPTSLGFAVVLAGLCLAATRPSEDVQSAPASLAEKQHEPRTPKRVAGRSEYANRLHGPSITPDKINGSVDR